VSTNNNQNTISEFFYFASPIYIINLPQHLEAVKKVSEESLAEIKKRHGNACINYQGINFSNDPRLDKFSLEILNIGWDLLDNQGFNMSNYRTTFHEMWCQEHRKGSRMDQHVHGHGSQLIAFYFLETPENGAKPVFHDPRPGKLQIALPQKDITKVTAASDEINFTVQPGDLIISNAYLQHSFSQHENEVQPTKFVHMNMSVFYSPKEPISSFPQAEVI